MNIYSPSIPRHLEITDTMWSDLIWDPAMAAEVLLGYRLDAFQRVRLKLKWFTPFVIDSSGLDTGKTMVDWVHDQLRMLLIPDQYIGVFYPTGQTGRNTYWLYYESCKSKFLHAHLGTLSSDEDEEGTKATTRASACYMAHYRGGNKVFLPAPSFMKGSSSQSSTRYNVVVLEEWTHVDADAHSVGKKSGIDLQLIGRANRPTYFNKHHPVWGNKIHFSAPAKPRQHASFKRYSDHLKKANGTVRGGRLSGGGSPDNWVFNFSHKDWSNEVCHTGKTFRDQYRDDKNLIEVRTGLANEAEWLGEGLGFWVSSGAGWYTDEAVTNAQAIGRAMGLEPEVMRRVVEILEGK